MMQFYQWFLEPGEIQVRGFFSTIWNEINYKMSSNGNRFSSRNNDFVKLGNWTLVLNCSLITPIAFSTLHSDTNSDFLIPLFLQQSVVDKIVQLWNIKGFWRCYLYSCTIQALKKWCQHCQDWYLARFGNTKAK